jgi:hypothetical protein
MSLKHRSQLAHQLSASVASTRTHASIREEVGRILGEAAETDAREDEPFGQARGDELPGELIDRRSRLARLRRCPSCLPSRRPLWPSLLTRPRRKTNRGCPTSAWACSLCEPCRGGPGGQDWSIQRCN